MRIPFYLSVFLIIFGSYPGLSAQLSIGDVRIDTSSIVLGLDTPWEILWGPDNHIWFTERSGRVSRLNPENGETELLLSIPEVYEVSESGLLGMVLHPDFKNSPYVYLAYNYYENNSFKERLVRYTFNENQLESPIILLDGIPGASYHDGARLAIDEQQMLYMTTGDAGNEDWAQQLNSLNGKVLRMHLDGSVPEDNPYNDSYVWTLGHRNPQGLVFGTNGILYSSEHGPASDDEANIIEKGRNYGWPEVKGYCDQDIEMSYCTSLNVREPIAAWTPTLAVAGTGYYSSSAIPLWSNSLLITTLKEQELVSLKLNEDGMKVTGESRWFDNWWGRLRDVCISPDGRVFIAVSNKDGRGDPHPGDDRIIEIKPSESTGNVDDELVKNASSDVEIFPNPLSEDLLHIKIQGSTMIQIVDQQGKILFFESDRIQAGTITLNFPYSPGIYFIKIYNDHEWTVRKLLRF